MVYSCENFNENSGTFCTASMTVSFSIIYEVKYIISSHFLYVLCYSNCSAIMKGDDFQP